MAQSGGTIRKLILTVILVALLIVIFILAGGGEMLKRLGRKSEDIKGTIEQKAEIIEKTVEKLTDAQKAGEKK